MKAVMYHYVREVRKELPYFNFLHIKDFRLQIDHFQKRAGVFDRSSLLECFRTKCPLEKYVLTFDDGVMDHYDYVFEELAKRKITGIFYVPTRIFSIKKALDVHRIHYLLGKIPGQELLAELNGIITPEMLTDQARDEFRQLTYIRQKNEQDVLLIKRILNYYINYQYREVVLDDLTKTFASDEEILKNYYLRPEQMKEMLEHGMLFGSHSVNHFLMSKLTEEQQKHEIQQSFSDLDNILGQLPLKTFCYPYGGFHSFNETTERLLQNEGVEISFNVDPRDVTAQDLQLRPQAIPRYDCNTFPHGSIFKEPDR